MALAQALDAHIRCNAAGFADGIRWAHVQISPNFLARGRLVLSGPAVVTGLTKEVSN